jgi:hypothetical protein
LTWQLASALDHLHNCGLKTAAGVNVVVQRQLDNPAHVLVDADNDIRLLVTASPSNRSSKG